MGPVHGTVIGGIDDNGVPGDASAFECIQDALQFIVHRADVGVVALIVGRAVGREDALLARRGGLIVRAEGQRAFGVQGELLRRGIGKLGMGRIPG